MWRNESFRVDMNKKIFGSRVSILFLCAIAGRVGLTRGRGIEGQIGDRNKARGYSPQAVDLSQVLSGFTVLQAAAGDERASLC